jgi:hypothetical protein
MSPRLSIALLLGIACMGPLRAATFPVDDSASQPVDAAAQMQWRSRNPAAGDHRVEGATQVNIRLDTHAWVGKTGRIYMTLPPQPIGPVEVEWRSQGRLLSGKFVAGQRGLVYAGRIDTPRLEDLFTVVIRADGRLLNAPQRLRFGFEIDVE